MADDLIDQINAGLARYYAQKGVDYPPSDGGEGIFKNYCEENGMDEEGITDELDGDPEEALLVDFHEDTFPIPDSVEEDGKNAYILSVIRTCANNANAYAGSQGKYEALEVKPEHWKVSEPELQSTKKLYAAQLKTLFNAGMGKDNAILKLLAVGRKMGAPYLLYLADAYTRKKVDEGKDTMSVEEFARTSKHFKTVRNLPGGDEIWTATSAGVKSFFTRICPELLMMPPSKVKADLEKTCELIASALDFVRNRAGDQNIGAASCPFQFDACFAFNDVENAFGDVGSDNDDDDVDDDDDDDDDDDEEKKDDGKAKKEPKDWFGDVQGKLKAEALRNSQSKLTVESRGFIDPFKEFIEENDMAKGKGNKAYPHRRRFCALIDRRKGGAEDDLFFYEPPKNCDSFPEGEYVQLWYFDGPKTCILPNIGYNEGAKTEEKKNESINTGSGCDGKMLTFSFHADAEDCIRCYMYAMGQMMRFMPEDIIKVLPKFFVADENNTKWLKSGAPEKLVKEMKPLLVDAKFDAFYKSC